MPRKKKEVAENIIENRKIELTKEEMLERGKKVLTEIQKSMEENDKIKKTARKTSQKVTEPPTNDENKKIVSVVTLKESSSESIVDSQRDIDKKCKISKSDGEGKKTRRPKIKNSQGETKEEKQKATVEKADIDTEIKADSNITEKPIEKPVDTAEDKVTTLEQEVETVKEIEKKETDGEKKTRIRKTDGFVSGESVSFCGRSFTVLDQDEESVLLISNKLISTGIPFSMVGNNDWRKSYIKRYLQEEVLDTLNKEDLLPITIDLTADSGEIDYGETQELIAIPTDNMYRKYHNIIPEYKTSVWSATPWAVKYTDSPCFVSIRGRNKMLYSEKAENNIGVVMICKVKKEKL